MKFLVILSSVFLIATGVKIPKLANFNTACSFPIDDLGLNQPIFIRPGTSNFFHPERDGTFRFTQGQAMELSCDSGFSGPTGITGNTITITCSTGTTFIRSGSFHNIHEFRCREWPTTTLRRRTGQTCFNGATLVDVGFVVGTRFLTVFTSCHDPRTEENYFTESSFVPANGNQQRNVARPPWAQGDFFPGKTVDIMHTRNNQRNAIGRILGSSALAAQIIEAEPSDVFLARGHIAAMTDFISANEQRATFFFINTAPQFQTFNGGNWVSVEISSRRLAHDRNINLNVYTGTVGRVDFPDVNGVRRNLFIDDRNSQIPVPRLYYKILENPAARSGVVLIGVNNPHLSLNEINAQGYVICPDVSSRINYVSWSRTNLVRGFSYACEVGEFLRVVPHVVGRIGTITSLLV